MLFGEINNKRKQGGFAVKQNISLKKANPEILNKKGLLNKQQWQETLILLDQVGIKIKNRTRTIKNQSYIWYVLNCFQCNFIVHLNQNFRKMMLFFKQVNKCELPQEYKLLILNLSYIFDSSFFNYKVDSFKGLKSFVERTKTVFTKIEYFRLKIKQYQKIQVFFNSEIEQKLISAFQYIHKLSLPTKQYPQLKNTLIGLYKYFDKAESFFNKPQKADSFLSLFKQFKTRYKEIYVEKHDTYQQDLLDFYQNLNIIPEYSKLLENSLLTPQEKKIKQAIINFFPDKCVNKNILKQLEKKPYCSCGFKLHKNYFIPSAAKVQPLLKSKINILR